MSNLNEFVSNKVIEYLKNQNEDFQYVMKMFGIQECCNKNHKERPYVCYLYTCDIARRYDSDYYTCNVCGLAVMCYNCYMFYNNDSKISPTFIRGICCECFYKIDKNDNIAK